MVSDSKSIVVTLVFSIRIFKVVPGWLVALAFTSFLFAKRKNIM